MVFLRDQEIRVQNGNAKPAGAIKNPAYDGEHFFTNLIEEFGNFAEKIYTAKLLIIKRYKSKRCDGPSYVIRKEFTKKQRGLPVFFNLIF